MTNTATASTVKPWYEESYNKGILLAIIPDPYSGYRTYVQFEYTRMLMNIIREGSLIAVRNFSDRPRLENGTPDPKEDRSADFEEYSILQIDQLLPWHYAMEDIPEGSFPAFNIASARSAREDWTAMDTINRDDVSIIKCQAIPLKLSLRLNDYESFQIITDGQKPVEKKSPKVFADRSKPMLGYEAYLLTAEMTQRILNKGLEEVTCIDLGKHLVQHEVTVKLQISDLLRLHFGVFGYTGVGKSNLVSTIVRKILSKEIFRTSPSSGETAPSPSSGEVEGGPRIVLFDLMDEYTGLLIDQLLSHPRSKVVVAGRYALPTIIFNACEKIARGDSDASTFAKQAGQQWAKHIILPKELTKYRESYGRWLADLIRSKCLLFYESAQKQGLEFNLKLDDLVEAEKWGKEAYGKGTNFNDKIGPLIGELTRLLSEARKGGGKERDRYLVQIVAKLEDERQKVDSNKAQRAIREAIEKVNQLKGSRAPIALEATTNPIELVNELNEEINGKSEPFLIIVTGENDYDIAELAGELIQQTFRLRREKSKLDPIISFIFDEADVFLGWGSKNKGEEEERQASVIGGATLLARRGRKFGLGLGLATQRVMYLNTSIMAQPHTYFISKLPRKKDRETIADAFAISDETFKQTFDFTPGQWLVTSHEATGIKGTPFPVTVENANRKVVDWFSKKG